MLEKNVENVVANDQVVEEVAKEAAKEAVKIKANWKDVGIVGGTVAVVLTGLYLVYQGVKHAIAPKDGAIDAKVKQKKGFSWHPFAKKTSDSKTEDQTEVTEETSKED